MRLVIVSGSGRCGSSVLMQMLDAAGIKCAGRWPDFEDPRSMQGLDLDWLSSFEGAVKILDPHRYLPGDLRMFDACSIWLDRDRKQQARSWCKVGREVRGRQTTREDVIRIAKMLKQSRKQGVDCLWRVTNRGPLSLTFENLLARPFNCAKYIEKYLGRELDVRAMVGQVIPRPGACLPSLFERDMVKMGRVGVERMVREQRGLPTADDPISRSVVRTMLERQSHGSY